ncbi:MAG: hypothetical protein ACRCU6_07915 [Fusobacteriaceae bacterium]
MTQFVLYYSPNCKYCDLVKNQIEGRPVFYYNIRELGFPPKPVVIPELVAYSESGEVLDSIKGFNISYDYDGFFLKNNNL